MIVDIDYIRAVKKRFSEINQEDLESITWIKNGKEVVFSKDDLDSFKFTGLNNVDIIDVFEYEST